MRTKLICLITITALLGVILSVFMFGITSSAEVIITEDAVLIEAGEYRFNDVISYSDVQGSLPFVVNDFVTSEGGIDVTFSISFTFNSIAVSGSAQSVFMGGSSSFDISYSAGGDSGSVSTSILVPYFNGELFGGYTEYSAYNSLAPGLGQTITVLEDTVLSGTEGIAFGTWFRDNTTSLSPPSTVTFESGFYDLKVPYVNLEASWIGESGQSVYYPIPCKVVNGFNNYVDCNGFGIKYISNENGYSTLWFVDIDGLRYDWFILNTIQGTDGFYRTNLQYLGGDSGLTSTKIYFPTSFEMDQNGGGMQFFSTFEITDAPPYEGNAFFDIVDAVVEALDVDVFGYFSPLDVIKSIAGLMLGLWLLKLLAGG